MTDMHDMQVDALVRRLDALPAPPAPVVEATFAVVAEAAAAERRRQARPWWPLVSRLRRTASLDVGDRRFAPRVRALVLIAIAAALMAAAALLIAGQRSTAPPWLATQIVYGRSDRESGAWEIFVIRADGTGERPLLGGSHDITRVSHDGQRIATATLGTVVFPTIYDVDGTKIVELHPDPTLNLGAMAWSRDNQWLAFEAWDDSNPARDGLYRMRVNGTGLERLTARGIPGEFSPDDASLVFSREGVGLFVIDVDGTGERQIGTMRVDTPGWFRDGRSIYAGVDLSLWRIDPTTGSSTVIATPNARVTHPRLTPDGTRFVMSLQAFGGASRGIWVVNVDGSGLAQVVDADGVSEAFPGWLP